MKPIKERVKIYSDRAAELIKGLEARNNEKLDAEAKKAFTEAYVSSCLRRELGP